jgi:eukaryotic-like serine/threonine-protein kinase
MRASQDLHSAGRLRSAILVPRSNRPDMSPAIGARLGSYEIRSLLGAGGMGEVFRAYDSKLGREVALKTLPALVALDPDRLARFKREAQVLASLNHPNIAAIYGFEDSGSVQALVLELVPGPTLAERIAEGPIPTDEVLTIAKQICDALEAAHEQGIIHRDLKPANIKVRADGTVKVLDFGLAKALEPATPASGEAIASSTITSPALTRMGVILGTAAYMSPEQATGQAADKRSDIWAFGCLLYEMLSGRFAFRGETVSHTIAAILEREPEWVALPADTPAGIRLLLRRCLDKNPKRRLHDIADARIEIDDDRSGVQQDGRVAGLRAGWRLAWTSVLALLALMAAAIGGRALRPELAAPEMRLEINTPPTPSSSLAIAPDGLKMVFVARSAGQTQLWLRSLDSSVAHPLPGTERASSPFWSPDSRSVGFFAGTRLKRLSLDGGSGQTLVSDIAVPLGGTWNSDGTILFANSPSGPIFRISAAGGEPTAATWVKAPQQRGHFSPLFLPDGRHFLFFVTGSPEARGVYVGQLDGLNTKRLFNADGAAVYAATGHVLFIREGKLLAQDFDADRLDIRGDPFPIAELATGGTALSASAAGPIAYRTSSANSGQRQLVWVDRSGREMDKEVYRDTANVGPALSHDGRRVAVYRLADGNMDIWTYDRSRRTWERITFHPGDDIWPLWSRDGTSMVFGAVRKTNDVDLYRSLVNGPAGSEELLLSTSQPKFPIDWSADGRFLLYDSLDPKRGFDIWALPLEGDRKPFAVVQTDFDEGLAQFSPDGTWIAYQSDKTGRFEIYLRPFRAPGGDVPASIDGGSQVRWNPNGKELFYIAADGRLMGVSIRFSSDSKTVEPGIPVGLFPTGVDSSAGLRYRQQYVVSPDGQSFVMHSVVGEASTSPITVILNWKPNR